MYYVDGKQYATLTNEVPDRPSRILLNHWSSNIPTWGGKVPKEDALMLVDWVYFSSEYKAPPSKFLSVYRALRLRNSRAGGFR